MEVKSKYLKSVWDGITIPEQIFIDAPSSIWEEI